MEILITEKPKIFYLKDGEEKVGEIEQITSAAVGAKKASVARITLRKPDYIHACQEKEEIYIGEKGYGKIFLNEEILKFGPGDRAIIPPGVYHAVKPANPFSEITFLCISSPPFKHKDVILDRRRRKW